MGWQTPLKQRTKKAPSPGRRTSSKLDSEYIAVQAIKGCRGCPLDKAQLISPKMKPTGASVRDTEVYIIGEAPGADEDEQGVQFVGASGQLLRKEIPKELDEYVRFNNCIRCRPPANREPAPLELACCRHLQEEDIVRSKPRLILGFGNVPLAWMLGAGKKITAWRGRLVPVSIRNHQCWFMPMLHPAFVLRAQHQQNGQAIEGLFRRDIDHALEFLSNGIDTPAIEDPGDKDKGVRLLYKGDDIVTALQEAASWPEYSIDIETNALRPFAADARILTCAVSNYESTFAFPLEHKGAKWKRDELKRVKDELRKTILNGGKPIAHNSKFEQEWLAFFFGPEIVHEAHWQDTMAQAYVLDEREGAKSLEAVSTIALGMNVKALVSRSGRRVDVMKLDDELLDDVLDYNAYDAKYTYPIYWLQAEKLEEQKLTSVYQMMNDRAGPFALAQIAGVVPDIATVKEFDRFYKRRITKILEGIQKDKSVVAFVKEHKRFLPSSPKDVLELFYHRLKFRECEVHIDKRTGEIKLSTNEEVLKQIKHPVASAILELRHDNKLHGTYIVPFLPETADGLVWPDGLIHTSYNHLRTGTGRTSSDSPNLQQFPSRTDRQIRRIIVVPKNHWLVSCDYGQIEARVIAMASQCSVLIKALWEGYDIHGEWTQRIAAAYPSRIGGKRFLQDKAVMKDFRDKIKNAWTFPLFFGSILESVARDLEVPVNVLAPLYDDFWEMFETVHVWQEELRKFYAKHGYVETLTGRRRHGPLTSNELINAPIQGTASDIVVDASQRLSKQAYELRKPHLQYRLNIHDDLSFYLPDKSLDDDVAFIGKQMVKPCFDFINVPIVVEVKVGKNWGDMEEIGKISSTDYGHKKGD